MRFSAEICFSLGIAECAHPHAQTREDGVCQCRKPLHNGARAAHLRVNTSRYQPVVLSRGEGVQGVRRGVRFQFFFGFKEGASRNRPLEWSGELSLV